MYILIAMKPMQIVMSVLSIPYISLQLSNPRRANPLRFSGPESMYIANQDSNASNLKVIIKLAYLRIWDYYLGIIY